VLTARCVSGSWIREGRGGAQGGGGAAAAVRGGRGAGGVRHRARGVGVRRGGAAVVPGGGVPLHPAAADVPGARPSRQGLPALAMAAARVLAPEVRYSCLSLTLPFAPSFSPFFCCEQR
jgi:hypothetical protein